MTGTAIKVKIQRLIDAEDPKKPYSDSVIASKLQDDGITIARRTVAKYREAMGHLSASKRKRLF
jgi:RNA polymerase sigma-54 factor